MSDHLDWSDPAAIRRLLIDMRVHLDDMDSVVKDMLAKKRHRNLGHRQHRRLYRESRDSVLAAIEHAMPPETTPVQ
jgi:hypothetical protein